MPLTEERCDELHLELMSSYQDFRPRHSLTEAVDARVGVSTGISASDRAITFSPPSIPRHSRRTSRVPATFSRSCTKGGVLVRAGQTEAVGASISRARRLTPAGVICEIMGDDGPPCLRVPQPWILQAKDNLKMLTVADLIRYRMQHERYRPPVAEASCLRALATSV